MSASFLSNNSSSLANLHTGSFTVSGWFKLTSPDNFTATTLILAPAWKLALNPNGTLVFLIRSSAHGDAPVSVVSSSPVTAEWNFFTVRCDLVAETIAIYLNGANDSGNFSYAPDSTMDSFTNAFQLGTEDRVYFTGGKDPGFSIDEVSVWSRVLTDSEVSFIYGSGLGEFFPYLGGAFNLIFQGELINDPQKPLVVASGNALWNVNRLYDGDAGQYQGLLDPLFAGVPISQGYSWSADNFNDKIIFAQHDNVAQYWTPPLPLVAHDLPGLPASDSKWDGTASFAGHVLLWKDDRLKWSDKDDFSLWYPVAETSVSTSLSLADDFLQPAPGGTVTVNIINPVAEVKSISLNGDLAFDDTAVGDTETLLLTIENTGTAILNVTGLSLPDGFTGNFIGSVPVGGSQPVVITFAPSSAVSYDGAVIIASDATTGTTTLPISGTGTGTTREISLGGILDFGKCKVGKTLTSALLITNTGNATLTVTGITLPGGFSGSFAGTIAAGATHIVPVVFTPAASLLYSGNIVVASNSTSGTGLISVSGTGASSLSGRTVFMTDNGSCQFGKVATGSTPTGTVRIYNPSSNSFNVIGLTLPAGFSGAFSGNINAFSSVDVTITFSPIAAQLYGGSLYASFKQTVAGLNFVSVAGIGTASGKIVSLSGDLAFGQVPVNGTATGLLKIKNVGDTDLTVSSISYPSGYSGDFSGVISPGTTKSIQVTFSPTAAISYSGSLTVNSDKDSGTDTLALSGTGFTLPAPVALVTGQVVFLADKQGIQNFYNYYSVVSMTGTVLVLSLLDLTGASPSGSALLADGRQFVTVDANEAGEDRVVGARMNGPIFKIIAQGDYAYSFKERSIQSIQYTGLGNGTFFIHNEVSGEGLIAREAIIDRQDGVMVFLGHRELYAYQGGPNLTPVCQQATRQLYAEIDRTRLYAVRLFHNENRKEVWVKYPVTGGFRVLIWNYIEDSASFDDYPSDLEFTALSLVDWFSDVVWSQSPATLNWEDIDSSVSWESLGASSIDHIPLLASQDGNLRLHGQVYSRDGEGYLAVSETMDFDLGEPDIYKYVDVVVLGLDVKVKDNTARYMTIQVGSQAGLSGADITWSDPQQILVNGQAPIPVKVNPGGSGRYLRLRFSSDDPDVQWRVSSFEIHCRPGGFY